MKLTLDEITFAVNGKLNGDGHKTISTVVVDSRNANESSIYIAQIGERVDGHIFVPELAAKGIPCVVSKKEYAVENTILTDNTKQAVYDIAKYYRINRIPDVKVIAVTGSVGKTTVKNMAGLVFSSQYKTYITKGNSNSLIGVPLSVLGIEPDDEYAVLEVGMSERGEISKLSDLVKPYLSIITVIGSSHLEALGSRDNIRKEKFDILQGESECGSIILGGDSDEEYDMRNKIRQKAIYCGEGERNDFVISDTCLSVGKTQFYVNLGGNKYRLSVPYEGKHAALDATYAFAAGHMCGVTYENAEMALKKFVPYGDRQHIYEKDGVTVIADCYNASPESMKAVFSVMKTRNGRKIAVLGDMLELGSDSEEIHIENAVLASQTADVLIFVGDYAAKCKSSVSGEAYAYGIDEKSLVSEKLKKILKFGDILLFKGSRRISLDDIIEEVGL